MHRLPVSKSTKRRRYLEEIEMVDFLIENQHEQILPQSSTSNINDTNLITDESQNVVSFSINMNNTSGGTFSNIDFDDHSIDNHEYEYYSSDSDNECISNENNIFDSGNSVLKLLTNWTVENNITLSALSALLKILKTHNCFNHFPIDARTVLKTNKSNESN